MGALRFGRKRKLLVFLILLFTINFGYVILNPPLQANGTSYTNERDFFTVSLENLGVANISLRDIRVNGNETPVRVELGVSRSDRPVLRPSFVEVPSISFHEIGDYVIKPVPSPNTRAQQLATLADSGESSTIFHYGICIYHDTPIDDVTIHYSYLGLPFRYQVQQQ